MGSERREWRERGNECDESEMETMGSERGESGSGWGGGECVWYGVRGEE